MVEIVNLAAMQKLIHFHLRVILLVRSMLGVSDRYCCFGAGSCVAINKVFHVICLRICGTVLMCESLLSIWCCYTPSSVPVLTYWFSGCHYPTKGFNGSKDYSIMLFHSRVLRADSASDLSNMAFLCCLDFYIGLWQSTTTTSFICMTIQTHTVLQKLCLGIKITTQGNYVTLIIICHEHQNKQPPTQAFLGELYFFPPHKQ